MNQSSVPGRSDRDVLDSKILIVDDEETNVRLLEYLLRRKGYRSTYGVTDPRTVVPIYQAFCPDLILLDLVMPHINGIELMEKLQRVERETYHPLSSFQKVKMMNPESAHWHSGP